jgi:transposase
MVHTMKSERRQHDRAFKDELVRQSMEAGASVSAIALRHGINANMLFKWRRDHARAAGQRAAPAVLLAVEVAPQAELVTVPTPAVPATPPQRTPSPSGFIELEFADVQVRVRGPVDEVSLCSVLRALRQAR